MFTYNLGNLIELLLRFTEHIENYERTFGAILPHNSESKRLVRLIENKIKILEMRHALV